MNAPAISPLLAEKLAELARDGVRTPRETQDPDRAEALTTFASAKGCVVFAIVRPFNAAEPVTWTAALDADESELFARKLLEDVEAVRRSTRPRLVGDPDDRR